jgi:hypothetical protein
MSYEQKEFPKTMHQAGLIIAAMKIAIVESQAFTLASFAAKSGYKANRHTAYVLNRLVREGLLERYSMVFSDNKSRLVYMHVDSNHQFQEIYRRASQARKEIEQRAS